MEKQTTNEVDQLNKNDEKKLMAKINKIVNNLHGQGLDKFIEKVDPIYCKESLKPATGK